MQDWMSSVLMAVQVISSLLIIGLVLLQQGDEVSRPQEHSCLCDWGERPRPTTLRRQIRRAKH